MLATAAFAQHAAEPRPEPIKNVFWQPDQLPQGSPMLITCELTGAAQRVIATWRGKRFTFFPTEKPHIWYALAGVDLDTQPGPYDLKVSALMRTGHWASSVKSVTIEPGNFGAGEVQVPEQYVQPGPDDQKQIERDGLLKKRVFARDIRLPLWSGSFAAPVDAPATPSFGETHLLNEEKTSRHLGTDFPCKRRYTGTRLQLRGRGARPLPLLRRQLRHHQSRPAVLHHLHAPFANRRA